MSPKKRVETVEDQLPDLDVIEMLFEPTEDDLENHWLIDAKAVVVDVETQAKSETFTGKYGTTYLADIIAVSMHVDGYPTVAIMMPQGETEDTLLKREFIKKVLTNKELIIGQNIAFDLRVLGGHFGFNFLNVKHPNVWDTMIMATMLMMAQSPDESALERLGMAYNLIGDREAQAFYASMKSQRSEFTLDSDPTELQNILHYVCMDTQITNRLYQLQKAVIATSDNKDAEPACVWTGADDWTIEIVDVAGKPNRFVSTKNWKNLPELIMWEQKKLWIASCMAIRGMKLDKEYVELQRNELLTAYAESLTTVLDMIFNDPTHDARTRFVLPFALVMQNLASVDKIPNIEKWVYTWAIWETCGEQEPITADDFAYPGYDPVLPIDGRPTLFGDALLSDVRIEFDFVKWLHHRTPSLTDSFDDWQKAYIKAAWYEHFLTLVKALDDQKLVNKAAFQPWYVFGLRGVGFPTTVQLIDNPYLATPKMQDAIKKHQFWGKGRRDLTQFIADELDADPVGLRRQIMAAGAWSMSEDALTFYFRTEEGEKPDDPLMLVMHNMAQITRIDEFLKHAQRDGRIHSIVAPKAGTGRATHVTPNLGNLPMATCKGYLVTDDPVNRIQFSIDVSNAEKWMQALVFGDNALADACAASDFHWRMMEIYDYTTPDGKLTQEYLDMMAEVKTGSEEGRRLHKILKKLRSMRKRVTFGTDYGMGAVSLANQLGITVDEAQALIDAKDRAFSAVTKGKKDTIERCQKLFDQGYRPPFVVLWTGRRVTIPVRAWANVVGDRFDTKVEGYKGINYLQQGGVAELIWRAMILAQEEALERGLSLIIANQVHDEIVGDTLISEFWTVCEIIIRHIYNVIPEAFRNRTMPACRFLAQIGPENADKWGYQYGVEYPIDKTKFINYWGIWDMPEGDIESPTWPGPIHEGYTVEGEVADRIVEQARLAVQDGNVNVNGMSMWQTLNNLQTELVQITEKLAQFRQPIYVELNGKERGPFLFPERMAVYQALASRGHEIGQEYMEIWDTLGDFVDRSRDLLQWWTTSAPINTPRERAQIEFARKQAEQAELLNGSQ